MSGDRKLFNFPISTLINETLKCCVMLDICFVFSLMLLSILFRYCFISLLLLNTLGSISFNYLIKVGKNNTGNILCKLSYLLKKFC